MESGEIAELKKELQNNQRGNDEEDDVFDLDEGVVVAPGIGMVDDEPEARQQDS